MSGQNKKISLEHNIHNLPKILWEFVESRPSEESEKNVFGRREEGEERYLCSTGGSWRGAKSIAWWEFKLKPTALLMY